MYMYKYVYKEVSLLFLFSPAELLEWLIEIYHGFFCCFQLFWGFQLLVLNFPIETGLIEGKVNLTQLTERVKRRSHAEFLKLKENKESKSDDSSVSLLIFLLRN